MLSCDLSTREMEAGKSEVEGQPRHVANRGSTWDTQDPVSRKKLWQGLGFGFKQGEMGGKATILVQTEGTVRNFLPAIPNLHCAADQLSTDPLNRRGD